MPTRPRARSTSRRWPACCGATAATLAHYAERLADPALRKRVRGYLTGSLDLVIRLPDGRFAIADHKTNWLAAPGEELAAWHYRPAALAAEMAHAHYGLQALLYTVALHRYLRWRLPGHDPARDIAGVLYLFVRGMLGPDTPVIAERALRRVRVAAGAALVDGAVGAARRGDGGVIDRVRRSTPPRPPRPGS